MLQLGWGTCATAVTILLVSMQSGVLVIDALATNNTSDISTYCRPYQRGGFCSFFIGERLVFGDVDTMKRREDMIIRFVQADAILRNYGVSLRRSCIDIAWDAYCAYSFPMCDTTGSVVKGQPICRETCEFLMKLCDKEMEIAKGLNKQHNLDGYPYYWKVFNCTEFSWSNGGETPECYYHPKLNDETDKLESKVCYYGNGIGYRGKVNLTRSGIPCQAWSSQCPHRHLRTHQNSSELVNASNWCRNVGGQAPDGPWCYTTDPRVRWEYCNIPKCPNPPPSKPPASVKAIGLNSTAILVSWVPVPLDFIHGTPTGYRVLYKSADGPEENMLVWSNKTEVVISSLPYYTNFSVHVLAVNKYGDGPRSQTIHVVTTPKNIASLDFEFTLVEEIFHSDLSDQYSLGYLALAAKIKDALMNLFVGSTNFRIYSITVVSFRNGSVIADVRVLAQFSDNQTRSAVDKELQEELVQEAVSGKIGELQVSSFLLKGDPLPPTELGSKEVAINHVTLTWSQPVNKDHYGVKNLTVQFRRSVSTNFLDAHTLGPEATETFVRDLEPNTNYVFRILANNDYGSGASEEVKVTTLEGLLKVILLSVTFPVIFVILVVSVVFIWIRSKRMKRKIEEREIAMEKLRTYLQGDEKEVEGFEHDIFDLLNIRTSREWWEIPRHNVTIGTELGSGAFGIVKKGLLFSENGSSGTDCAVKMLKAQATEKDIRDLCNELNLMAIVGEHPNVVGLIGACSIKGPLWLVVKYAANGSLLRYLEKHRQPEYEKNDEVKIEGSLTDKDKLKLAFEIANGMAHLTYKKCVHRDLAARNVLLDAENTAMVSDFGLSRDVYESGTYENTSGGMLPVRWMAPESLEEYTYTTKSDVWSFGVILWEIESLGRLPYAGMSGTEIIERIRRGYRLPKPEDCGFIMYGLMSDCWRRDPVERPSFQDLVQRIGEHLLNKAGYLEVIPTENG